MNIFYLDKNITKAAQYHNDKHCVKMCIEYAQLLSTAHRMLDGKKKVVQSTTGRKKIVYMHPDKLKDSLLYSASWSKHPCAIWTMESKANYKMLYRLFKALCKEYTYRYNKIHLSYSKLGGILQNPPVNIPTVQFTEPQQVMPEEVKNTDSIVAYRTYYNKYKKHISVWTKREIPYWVE